MIQFDSVVLSCLQLSGEKKYDLPAQFLCSCPDYEVFFRPKPIIHHYIKNSVFELAHPELVLVPLNACHVISIALKKYQPIDMYVNINNVPIMNTIGYQWIDLEIDIKITLNHSNEFVPIIVDCDEFDSHVFRQDERLRAEQEITALLDQIAMKKFPFNATETAAFAESKLKNFSQINL